MDIKKKIDSTTVIVADIKTILTPMNRYSRQKTNKETLALKDTRLNRFN